MAMLDFPLGGSSLAVVEKSREELSDILQSKFQCVASIEGVNIVFPERRFTVTLPNGVAVSVWKVDLSKFQADAVVNASNVKLQHWGGLALALAKAGGPQIQTDSDEYIRKNGPLKPGDAVVTDAGWLNYKKIIHAVGPQLSTRSSKSELQHAEFTLRMAIWKILNRVEEYRLQSVAIPAISSGIFNFPLRECANTIVSAVNDFYGKAYNRPAHIPKEILLANIDEVTVVEMLRACQQFLCPPTLPSYSQVASGRSATEASAMTVRVAHASLTLMQGHLEDQKTDVLVKILSQKSHQNLPTISTHLLQKAGDSVQKEFNKAYIGNPITCTNPGQLQCKELFHISWFKEDKVEDLVQDCLKMAVVRGHNSISIPTVVHPGLDDEEAAKDIVTAVLNYVRGSRATLDIHFVIPPMAVKMFKAYEKQMQALHRQSTQPNFSDAFGHQHSRAAIPRISLFGQSDEATHEAKHWLGQRCSSTGIVIICNNVLQHMGKDACRQLSNMSRRDLTVEEFLENGHSSIVVRGEAIQAAVTGIKVEALICKVLKKFVMEEEKELCQLSSQKVVFHRRVVDHNASTFSKTLLDLNGVGLQVVKVEKVENNALGDVFEQKKKQLKISSRRMFQRLPAHFCNVVCHVGFHPECAPPHDPAYGEGIYFTGTLKEAMAVWKGPDEKYLYFVEAEVLTGMSTLGSSGLILPPADHANPHVLYHSVHGGDDISVIFSGHQALPKYIYTCKKG